MDLKTLFAKKALFQKSLKHLDVYTEERFNNYKIIPVSPSDDVAMIGFIRHMTLFTAQQRDYLSNKVGIPVGIQQYWEQQLEKNLYDLWNFKNIDRIQQKIANIDTSSIAKPIIGINTLIKQLREHHSKTIIEATEKSTSNKTAIPEFLLIDLYAKHLSDLITSYEELLQYLFSNHIVTDIKVDDKNQRYIILADEDMVWLN